jgi:pyrroline-5-carboxylate reductase
MKNIGFIGVGNMGYAILSNYAKFVKDKRNDIKLYAYDTSAKKETIVKEGVTFAANNSELAEKSDYIAVLVKPQTLPSVLEEIKPYITNEKVIVSFAAGIDEAFYKKYLGGNPKIVFVMPNINILLGLGASAVSRTANVGDNEFSHAKNIVECGGIVKEIPADKMREVIALNASAPAFVFYLVKQFAKYAQTNGIDYETGIELFAQTLSGSAEMLIKSGTDPDLLIKQVCSPGGTTIAGMEKFCAVDSIVKETCEACTRRAYELSRG